MPRGGGPGRSNQRKRTRQALLDAAARLMREGANPTLEEMAEAALVSRATAYRYFSGAEPLLVEASLDVAMPGASAFAGDTDPDPVARLTRADAAVAEMIEANEVALRRMLIHALQRSLGDEAAAGLPARQNRRTPLIEAALKPVRDRLDPLEHARLCQALALVIGTEARIVFKDVLGLSDREAQAARHWAIRTLVAGALEGDRN